MALARATTLAHALVSERLAPGDRAIDATAGNGHDTAFLARTVGPDGWVLSIDLQADAIEEARRRCGEWQDVIDFRVADHADLSTLVDSEVKAIMFNLGYLPSSDKLLITKASSTLAALKSATELLEQGGILTIAVYTGHEGGPEESDAVEAFASALDQETFAVIQYGFLNQRNSPPHLIAIERRA